MTDAHAGPTFRIGDVVVRTGLSHRTVRHYDELGLVRPAGRSEGGFRLYTARDVERLLLIARMKPLGYSLDEMADLLDLVDRLEHPDDTGPLQERVAAFVAEAQDRRARLAERLAMADEFLGRLAALPDPGTPAP
ncbi:MerR family transcriptional regulator [Amnibacterium endophyticum]|uniref:MerR family transcriptional regulator n=1 Tax=Amnibacterium endophyticum TaxID=2109337 RepID=A0ABW4LB78_9MICO